MCRRLLAVLGALSMALAVGPRPTFAQTPPRPQAATPTAKGTPPRTSWGDPDLQGTWLYNTMTPFERPADLAGKAILTPEEETAYLQKVFARQRVTNNTAGPDWWDLGGLIDGRTSLIVDPPTGRIPPLTPAAQQRAAAVAQAKRERGTASVEDLNLNVRCLNWATAGPPMLPGLYNNNVQFFQTRDYFAILNEMIHDARIVPLDGRPHGTVQQLMGDSRGHWEGTTLVVDTVNFTDKTSFVGSDARLHLIERFTRIDQKTIEYRFTIEDPTIWAQVWTVMFPMRQTEGLIYEYACHEGNARSIEGIFSGDHAAINNQGR